MSARSVPVYSLADCGNPHFASASLILPASQTPQLGGLGGLVECKFAQTRLAFTRDDGQRIVVKGPFSIFAAVESSDIAVLGRDVTNNFDVIYSFPKREVLLLARPHDYLTQLPAILILTDRHPVARKFIHERHERTRRKPRIRVWFVLFRVISG